MSLHLETAPVAGRAAHYVDSGARPRGDSRSQRTVVLLHGFPLGVQMWKPQLDAFPGWRVIVPALPGYDGSEAAADASMDLYARHVLALLDHLGIDRAVFGGLSMGGYVTFSIMRQAPDRARGLILADTRAPADTDEQKVLRRRMLDILEREGARAVAMELMARLLAPATMSEHPEIVAAMRQMIEIQTRETIAASLRAMMERPDSRALLPTLSVPTVLLVGVDDVLTPVAESEAMRAAIPGSTLVTVPAAGHMSNLENADAFNAAVREFLDRLPD
jgi:pimeloyl-ACP methyl ester carboxylesterase